ncbi:MAG: hypothetical protein KatS3mg115_2640 [Candidatus Poribacteria bacterium]|nr:MAG: hypothetical protein KatS3mg115_2640 [Candidatus Poribacteria bacterium]
MKRFELLEWTPPELRIRIVCSRGTYVRTLAHEIGRRLGCGGHLAELVRTRSGPFRLEEAVPLDRVLAVPPGGPAMRPPFGGGPALDEAANAGRGATLSVERTAVKVIEDFWDSGAPERPTVLTFGKYRRASHRPSGDFSSGSGASAGFRAIGDGAFPVSPTRCGC